MPELRTLALAVRLGKPFTEIDEQWSERDVNLTLFFIEAQTLAGAPSEREFALDCARRLGQI